MALVSAADDEEATITGYVITYESVAAHPCAEGDGVAPMKV